MRVETLRGREPPERRAAGSERRRQESAGTARIDDKAGRYLDVAASARAFETDAAACVVDGAQLAGIVVDAPQWGVIKIDRACLDRFKHECPIEVRPIPVRVCDVVVRAGADE